MKKLFIALYILPFVLISCEKELDINLPDTEKHIVVNGMINPDSLFRIRVSKSRNILDTSQFEYLSNASVKLYTDGINELNMISMENGYFGGNFYPEIGKRYTITVDYPPINSVSTEVTLKEPVPILELDTTMETIITDYGDGWADTAHYVYIDLTLKDNSTTNDFYFLSITSLQPWYDYSSGSPVFMGYQEYSEYIDSQDPSLRRDNNTYALDGSQGKIFSDELFNGDEHTFQITLYLSKYYYNINPMDISTYYIKLYTVSEDLFKFVNSYNLSMNTGFDPFAQAVQIYSNIDSGLGFFSGYTVDIDSLNIQF
jgi:hypothetical protein